MLPNANGKACLLRLFAAFALGILWALAYPKWGMSGFAWLAPGGLLALGLTTRSKAAFGWSYLTSWIHAAATLYWLLNMPYPPGAVAAWLSLTAYLALFPAAWTWIMWKYAKRLGEPSPQEQSPYPIFGIRQLTLLGGLRFALGGAVLWGGLECFVSHFLTGFPWLLLGATQLPWTPIAQGAAYGGIPFISTLIAWVSIAAVVGLSRIDRKRPQPWKWIPDMILPVIAVLLLAYVGLLRVGSIEASKPANTLKVAVIQPAFPQDLIWDDAEDQTRFEELLRLSEAAVQTDPDLLVWPEGAFPGSIDSFAPVWDLLAKYEVWLCFNGTDAEEKTLQTDHPVFYNTAFLMDPAGKVQGTYHKRHLVIFGEYVPLADLFPFLKMLTPIQSLFTPGSAPRWFELNKPETRLYPLICFEDVMPYLARASGEKKTDLLINLTNDGWFKNSAAQLQHGSLAAFRCIENGLPMIRCGNNGLTCWIDPAGHLQGVESISDETEIYGKGFKTFRIPLGWTMPRTVYRQGGHYFGMVCCLFSICLILDTLRRRRNS
jgi:apolipoprotein N-acyltransferase